MFAKIIHLVLQVEVKQTINRIFSYDYYMVRYVAKIIRLVLQVEIRETINNIFSYDYYICLTLLTRTKPKEKKAFPT